MSGFNVLLKARADSDLSKFDEILMSRIELTFVDLLEHFIMDSSVFSQLMTLSLSLYWETEHVDQYPAD